MNGISVVMPVYNVSNLLYTSIESIQNQTLKDIEIICVDDGSTDDSLEILTKLNEKYNNIKIIEQKNAGPGIARNTGIEASEGEYIAFLDADDIFLDESALEKMYDAAQKTGADMVGANLKFVNKDYSLNENYDYINTRFTYYSKEDNLKSEEYGIPFAFYKNIFKKEMLDKFDIKFPDLSRGQDPVFLANVLTKIDEIPVLNTDLYGYNNKVLGGVNLKVNTYQKKYDYVKHFKDTLDILKDNEFDASYEGYKREFIKYITFEDNLHDSDLKKIIPEVFGDIDYHFDKNDYGYNYLELFFNDVDLSEINKELINFSDIKQFFFEETLINDNFIDEDYLREYVLLVSQNSDKKAQIEQLSFNSLKTVEKHVLEDKEYLSNELVDITKKMNQLNDNPKEIANEDGLKLSKFIETMKHFYKKW